MPFGGGGAFTTNETVVECVAEVPVPVMVSVEVPAGVEVLVVTVKVELPPAVTDVGLKLPVAPAGRPDTLRSTVCALPLVTAVVTL